MPNFSSITLIGHLGRDAEARTVGDTTKVEFSVATTRKRKDQEVTTWWRCSFWGDRAAKVCQYLDKGKAVCVQGEVYQREWEKDGKSGTSLEVEVRELVLLGDGKRDGEQAAPAAARPTGETIGRDGLRRNPPVAAGGDDDLAPPF